MFLQRRNMYPRFDKVKVHTGYELREDVTGGYKSNFDDTNRFTYKKKKNPSLQILFYPQKLSV